MKFQILLVGFTFKRRCAVVSRYLVAYFEINGTTGHEPAQVTWTYSNIGTSQTAQNSKQIHPISQVSTAMESNPPLLCPFCIILLWTKTSLAFWSNSWRCFEQVTGRGFSYLSELWIYKSHLLWENFVNSMQLEHRCKDSMLPSAVLQVSWHTCETLISKRKKCVAWIVWARWFKIHAVGSSVSSVNATRPGRVSAGMAASSCSPEELLQKCFKYAILPKPSSWFLFDSTSMFIHRILFHTTALHPFPLTKAIPNCHKSTSLAGAGPLSGPLSASGLTSLASLA